MKDEIAWSCTAHGTDDLYDVSAGKSERKISPRRPGREWIILIWLLIMK
jgi:hypothetical protein